MSLIVSGFHTFNAGQTCKDGFKSLVFFDSCGAVLANVECRFPAHSICRHPTKRNEFLIFDKGYQESARVILQPNNEGKVDYFSATREHLFYGHGFYLPDGKSFICTERKKNLAGKLTLRDSNDFRVIREYPLKGIGPHDSVLMGDGVTVAVACDGLGVVPLAPAFRLERSQIVYLNLESGEHVGESACDRDDLALGHLAVSTRREVFALMNRDNDVRCAPSGLFAVGRLGESMRSCAAPDAVTAGIVEQQLSMALDENRRLVVVVSPQSNLVTSWSMDGGTFLGSLETNGPAGVALSSRPGEYLVTAYPNRILRLNGDLEIIEEVKLQLHGQFETHILKCE